jgi:hypothetical protein
VGRRPRVPHSFLHRCSLPVTPSSVRIRAVTGDDAALAFHFSCWFKTGLHDVHIVAAPEQMF